MNFKSCLICQDFADALSFLDNEGCLGTKEEVYLIKTKEQSTHAERSFLIDLLSDLIRPFQLNYQMALQVAVSARKHFKRGFSLQLVPEGEHVR